MEARAEGMTLRKPLAGDVTMGCGFENSERSCRSLFWPFVSKMVPQRYFILEAVLSVLPFLLTWAWPLFHQVLEGPLALGPTQAAYLKTQTPPFLWSLQLVLGAQVSTRRVGPAFWVATNGAITASSEQYFTCFLKQNILALTKG